MDSALTQFLTFPSTPGLPTWLYFLFLFLNSSFVSTTYFLPLPRIFSGETLTLHFSSEINRFTSFVPGQSLSRYHRSCVLPGWLRPSPPIILLTLEYFISSSLFFGRVEFMQFYFIIKKKSLDFSHHILLPFVVKIILNLWLFFVLFFPLPVSTSCRLTSTLHPPHPWDYGW